MKRAFTLIELMVVISVIAILSTIALFGFRAAQDAAKDSKKLNTISGLRSALERYYADNGVYPAAYADLIAVSFSPTYMPNISTLTDVDSRLIQCGAAPCITYAGGSTYTITFTKKAGGQVVFQNPQ